MSKAVRKQLVTSDLVKFTATSFVNFHKQNDLEFTKDRVELSNNLYNNADRAARILYTNVDEDGRWILSKREHRSYAQSLKDTISSLFGDNERSHEAIVTVPASIVAVKDLLGFLPVESKKKRTLWTEILNDLEKALSLLPKEEQAA